MKRRVLVVGGGAIARRAHIPALRTLERAGEAQLAAVVEPNAEGAAKLRQEFNVEVFASLEAALAGGQYDVLDFCTPSTLHAEGIAEGIRLGLPMVVEKPLITGIDPMRRLANVLAERDAADLPFIGVVQNYRYYKCVTRALQRIQNGFLGNLVTITAFAPARFPVSWTRSTWLYEQGGVFQDFAPHALDLLTLFAASPVMRVSAFGRDISGGRMGFVNYGQIVAEFQSGVLANLDASWVTGSNMFSVGLHGTSGHIDIDARLDYYREYHGTYTPFDDIRDFSQRMRATVRRAWTGEYFRGPLVFYPQLLREVFASMDSGTAASPRVATLAQGLNTSVLLATALQSVEQGRVLGVEEVVGDEMVGVLNRLYGVPRESQVLAGQAGDMA